MNIERPNNDEKRPEEGKSDKSALLADCWQPIETAPKDGTEVLGFREDAGVILMRWTAPEYFCKEDEMKDLSEECAQSEDWFYADFMAGGRMEGSEAPTHWMPLPEAPRYRRLIDLEMQIYRMAGVLNAWRMVNDNEIKMPPGLLICTIEAIEAGYVIAAGDRADNKREIRDS